MECGLSYSCLPYNDTYGKDRQESHARLRKVVVIKQGMSIPHLTVHRNNLREPKHKRVLKTENKLRVDGGGREGRVDDGY